MKPASHPEASAFDALIIGGGPGGSAAATFLARAGRRVAGQATDAPLALWTRRQGGVLKLAHAASR